MKTLTIASQTLTQLLRMRVIWVLAVFAIALFASSLLDADALTGTNESGTQSLVLLKNTGAGIIRLFAIIFSITATSLLIPRDLEDRVLYTVLSKSVPRWSYLAGKLLGVLALVSAISLVMMVALNITLAIQTSSVLAENSRIMTLAGLSPSEIASFASSASLQGPTWSFQFALLTILLESSLLAAITLLLSSFSSSSLFPMIGGFTAYFIGMLQGDAKASLFSSDPGSGQSFLQLAFSRVLSFILPDFQIYAISDRALNAIPFPPEIFAQLAGLTALQVAFYLAIAIILFQRREF